MWILYTIGGGLLYIIIAGFVHGICRANKSLSQAECDAFAGLWPIILLFMLISAPVAIADDIGFRLNSRMLEREKAKRAAQQKLRIELKVAEQEIENEFAALDRLEKEIELEKVKPSKRSNKKAVVRKRR